MEENLSKFVTAIIAIFIMVIFPVYIAYEKKDDVSYALALRYTQEFVDNVRRKGYITSELYNDYEKKLYTTGNTYDIELEHGYVRYDMNVVDKIGSATRNVEIFKDEHIKNILNNGQIYTMNTDDNFNVKIKNTNVTLATVIYNIVTVNTSNNNVRVYVDYGGKVLSEKWYEQGLIYSKYGGITDKDPYRIELTINDLDVNKEIINDDIIVDDLTERYLLSDVVKIGDYVEYVPDGDKTVENATIAKKTTITRLDNISWQVSSVDRLNKKVNLINSTPSTNLFYADIVNDNNEITNLEYVCDTLFKNSMYGRARCAKESDITNWEIGKKYLYASLGSVSVEYIQNTDRFHRLNSWITPSIIRYYGDSSVYSKDYDVGNSTVTTAYAYTWINNQLNIIQTTLRPVVELYEGILTTGCDDMDISNCGTEEKPWKLYTDKFTKTLGELVKVGDYVKYTSNNGINSFEVNSEYSGLQYYSSGWGWSGINQTINKKDNLSWHVFKKTSEKIYLISDSIGTLILDEATGVNNAVHLLNDICATLYSREGIATARSLNLSDLGVDLSRETFSKYLLTSGTYPSKYANSLYNPNSVRQAIFFEGLDADKYYDNNTISIQASSSKSFLSTYKAIALSDEIKNNMGSWITNTTTTTDYIGEYWDREKYIYDTNATWLANTFCKVDGSTFYWGVYGVFGGRVYWSDHYSAPVGYRYKQGGGGDQCQNNIRAVVELDADLLVDTSKSGNGSSPAQAIKLKY